MRRNIQIRFSLIKSKIIKTFTCGSHLVAQGTEGGDQESAEVASGKYLNSATEAMSTTLTDALEVALNRPSLDVLVIVLKQWFIDLCAGGIQTMPIHFNLT